MAVPRVDEVLAKALETDATVIPRFLLKDAAGNVLYTNVTIDLLNDIVIAGTPMNKVTVDECLAASGTTTGTTTALLLAQTGFTLFDGATARFKLHVAMTAGATLNIADTGVHAIVDTNGKPIAAAINSWVTVIYSSTTGNFILQGKGGGSNASDNYGSTNNTSSDHFKHISSFEQNYFLACQNVMRGDL